MIKNDFQSFPEHRMNFFILLKSLITNAFEAIFQVQQSGFNKDIIDAISWAIRHNTPNMSETGLETMLILLKNISKTKIVNGVNILNSFYKTYYFDIFNDIFGTMTDSFHQSGLKLQILQTSNSKQLISAKLFDGINDIEIEKNKTYKVASNNFLLNGGDDFAKVMKWYKIKDFEDYNDTRDNLIAYLKNVQLINSKNYIDELNPRILVIKETILRRLINKVLKYFK
jgi:hypothetical protein